MCRAHRLAAVGGRRGRGRGGRGGLEVTIILCMLVLSTVVAAPVPPPALPAAAGRRAGGSGGDAPPASESANSSSRLLPMPAPPPLPPPPRIIVSRPQDGGPLGGPFHFVDTVFRAARPGGAGGGGGGGGLLPPPPPPHLPALPPPPPLLAGLATLLLNRTFAGPPGLPLEVFDVGSDEEPAGVCERLRAANPDITACEPDSRVTLDANAAERAGRPSSAPSPTPDDPRFGEQWNLRAIRVPPAWAATGDLGTAAVRVCVVDTGVDVAHPDLAANIAVNPGEAAGRLLAAAARRAGKKDAPGGSPPAALLAPDGTDGDGNGIPDDIHGAAFLNGLASGDVTDDNGHGTFVAGVIGAVGNNALGIAGINQVSALIPCKFMDAGGGGWVSDAIRCWEYCMSRGAHVISNSWGGGAASAALRVGVAHAAERGVLVVTSAGNDAADTDVTPHFPSTLPDDIILSVAASTQAGTLWPKSNYGQRSVDVAAPGEKVLSTGPGGGFVTLSGTSMATPHAAGAAALVLQQFARLGWDLDTVPPAVGLGLQAKRALIKTARPLAVPPGMATAPPLAGGLLDVAAALAAVPRPPASAAKAAPTLGSDPASLAAAVARPAGDTVFYSTPDGAVIGASELSEPGPRSRTAGAPYTGALANVLSGSGGNLPTPVNGGGGWRSPAEAAAAVAAAGAAPVAAAAIPPGAATAPGPDAAAAAGSNAAGVRSGGEGTTTAAPVNPDAGDAVAEPDPSSTPPRFTPPPRPGSLVGWRIRAGRFAGAEEPGPVPATPLRPPGPTLVPRPGLTDEAPPGGLPALPGLVAGAPALAPGDPLALLVNPPPAEGGGDGEGGDGGGDGDGDGGGDGDGDDADAASSASSLAPAFGGGGVVSEEEEEEGEPGGVGAPPVITSFAQKHSGSGDGKKGKAGKEEDRPPATPKPPRPPRPTRPPKLPPPPPPSPEERAAAKADKKADARAHKAAKLEAKIEERVGPAGAAAAIAAAQAARGLPTPPPTLVADGLTRTWADAPAGGMAAAAPGPGGTRGGLTQTWAPAPPGGVARPPPGAPPPSSDNTAARPRIIPAAGQAPPVYLPLPGAPRGTYYYYENHDGDEGTPPRAVIFTDHDGDAGTAPLPLAAPPPELVARVPPVNRVGAGNGWGWGGANTIGNELIDAEVYGGTQGSSFVPVGYAGVRASAPAPAGGSAATTWAPAPPAAPVPGGTTWAPAVGGAVGAAGGQAAAPTPRAGAPARAPASSPKPTRPPRTPVPRPTLSPEAQAAKASARAARDAVAAARGEVRGGKAALRAADREGRDAVNAAIDAAHADMHPVRPCLPGIEEPGGRGKKACVVRGVDKPTGTLFVPAPPQSPGGAAAPAGAPPALAPAPAAPTTTMATPAGGGGGGAPATTAIPGQPDSDASRRDAADAAASLTDEGAGSSAAAAAAVDTSAAAAAGVQADMYAGSVSEPAAPDAQLFVSPADAVAGVGPAVAPGAGTLWADAPPGGAPPPPPAAASWAPASPGGDGLAAPPPPSAPGVTDTWAPAGPDGSGPAASSPPPPAWGWAPAVEPGAAGAAAGASSAATTWAPAVDATANASAASAAGPLPFASPRPADGLSRPGPGGLPPLFAGGGAGGAGAALPGTAAATANLAYPGTSTRGGALGGSYAPVGPGSALGAGAAAAAAAPPPPPPPGAGVLVSTGPVTGSAGDDAETRGAIPDEPEPDPDSWDPADVAAAGGASAFPGAEVVAALPEAAAKLSRAAAEATSAAALEGRLAAREGAGTADPAAAAAAAGLPARPWELVPDEAEARASIEAAAKGRVGAGAPAPALSPRRAGPPAPSPAP